MKRAELIYGNRQLNARIARTTPSEIVRRTKRETTYKGAGKKETVVLVGKTPKAR